MSSKAKVFWIVFLVSVAIDQATKLWVYGNLAEGPRGDVITVIPGLFDIVHAENPGAAFSFLRDFAYRQYVFLGFTVFACWLVWDQFKRLATDDRLYAGALALIGSGAIGNAIDRVWKQSVTDFLRIRVEAPAAKQWLIDTLGTNEYPSFNVADSVLLVGVIFFVFASGRVEQAAKDAQEPKTATGG